MDYVFLSGLDDTFVSIGVQVLKSKRIGKDTEGLYTIHICISLLLCITNEQGKIPPSPKSRHNSQWNTVSISATLV